MVYFDCVCVLKVGIGCYYGHNIANINNYHKVLSFDNSQFAMEARYLLWDINQKHQMLREFENDCQYFQQNISDNPVKDDQFLKLFRQSYGTAINYYSGVMLLAHFLQANN